MIKNIFFDFDGTICDTSEGVVETFSILEKHGFHPEKERVRSLIGKPLYEMMRLLTDESADIKELITEWRESYSGKGVFNSRLYPGIKDMLESLKGKRLFIISKKPEKFIRLLNERFGISDHFEGIYAIGLHHPDFNKAQALREWVDENQVSKKETAIVGDRKDDVNAGIESGIVPIGVSYGYGTKEELIHAHKVFDSVHELGKYLVNL